ncbi:MAG: hypothetical protein OEW19_19280 [Acidobacteriota bacterium]|nr:hypothetical protein [Acidobacteriota bacterium]
MDVGLRTPLLDLFRRGEVGRDLRLLAAGGAVSPRPLEQLGLLMLLASDADEEVRSTAEKTLAGLPAEVLGGLIARADVSAELRDFFVARGVTPAAGPVPDLDGPLVDLDDTPYGADEQTSEQKAATAKRVSEMTIPEKVKAAMKGTREMRAVLIRDPNRMVSAAVLSCPRLTEQEVETFARMANVSDEVLRSIGQTRGWMKNYAVMLGLAKNPKTPLAISLSLIHRLNDRDLRGLSIDRNVPEPLRIAARKKVVAAQK